MKYTEFFISANKMDILNIKDLSVSTKIGVHAWEQSINQQLLIDISIPTDFNSCEDNLAHTLDYDALCHTVTEFVQGHSFQLIETVANKIAEVVKQEFKVASITVSVTKPHAVKNAGKIQVIANR